MSAVNAQPRKMKPRKKDVEIKRIEDIDVLGAQVSCLKYLCMKGVVMEIRITLRHLEISEEIKKLVTRKVGKLQRYDPDIHLIEIIMMQEKFRHKVEILIKSRHFQMEAAGQHGNLQTCFDDVLAKIERRLIEHKKRFKDKKHRKTAPLSESADDET